MAHFGAFLGISLLVIVTPGQDTALTIRNTLLGGKRAGAATALGVAAGQATWTLFASAGIAAALRAWGPAFTVIRLAGAAYLIFLGAQALRDGLRRTTAGSHGGGSAFPPAPLPPAAAFRQGALSNLGNPKMAVFFMSLLPPFAAGGSFTTLLGLGLVFCALTLAWLTLYAVVVARAGDVLRRSGIRRTLDAMLGAVLIGLGLRLATEHR